MDMKKILYAYLNNEDFLQICKLLNKNGVIFYDYNKNRIEATEVPAISTCWDLFYIECREEFNENFHIEYSPCYYAGVNWINCAEFCLTDKNDSISNSVFLIIKKHIRQTFKLAQDKSYYYGPSIYQDWKNKKIIFPVLFEYEEILISEQDIEKVFAKILSAGYRIRNNFVRTRNLDILDLNADSFVVYGESSNIISTIVNKNKFRYEYGSDCVFIHKKQKTNEYMFLLDKRLEDDPQSMVVSLFYEIKKMKQEQINMI